MANIILPETFNTETKLAFMRRDARFDVSGSRDPDLLRDLSPQAKQTFKAPKVFLSNNCVFNCAYCDCRSGNDCKRGYVVDPKELAELSLYQARTLNQGIFITSAIYKNPDYTEELIIETLRIIRDMGYGGYLHAKVMPGTDPALIRKAARYANRLSVNIEVARSEGYQSIARNKNRRNILAPMKQISDLVRENAALPGGRRHLAAVSQCTQLMAGSTGESDRAILDLSGALYRKYGMKRVYYRSFQYRQKAAGYENLPLTITPHWRSRRLYQADRLMQLYGFTADEITPDSAPDLSPDLDPKLAWALRNIHLFPVEVNKADRDMLLRVPGIGPAYAGRILDARRHCALTHDALRALGVSLKTSRHFITCKGRYTGDTACDPQLLRARLAEPADSKDNQVSFGDVVSF